ncbi:protein O-mannosyl-transferase 2-like isoform X1 [Daphnia pulicaria]|uniref:protein O-mannosyl-transferase 2-like isoform X1 n=2 Tax=Daphnia pulicaria TaxID=35523 RepID=UPI001EECA407|nr:protein O-mannosyl-transferase 2-like isoform X1 [Daphnia pulicaria]XP_046641822.1 protein O-mannosyl-transferase 2-like isoform X1 [Daphnia pulicaria]
MGYFLFSRFWMYITQHFKPHLRDSHTSVTKQCAVFHLSFSINKRDCISKAMSTDCRLKNPENPVKYKQMKNHESLGLPLLDQFRDGSSNKIWWRVFALLMIATVATRFYKLDQPDHVCWDEAHFGKYANFYINRTFFFDVHPPLGKMLIGLFGYLDGYNGSFHFDKPGDKFEDHQYMGMRIGCAVMGALLVPLSFLTVWEMTFSLPASTLSGLLILLDHGMLTLNRFILLDPPMLFFISASVYTMVKFHNQRHRPFSMPWWLWLSSMGVMLSCSVAVKFVGIFVVIFVGFRTIADLWEILGDISRPVTYTVKHFMARALCLIVIPTLLYMGIFYIHLAVLNNSGPGDGFYSSAFQVGLKGNYLHDGSTPREVAYGAILTLKNSVTSGAYLHSHDHLYPEEIGGGQQQITTYAHKDENNQWHIKRHNKMPPSWNSTKPVDLVRHGDLLRLEHFVTGRNLHAHRVLAPITIKQFQVTGYGLDGVGDTNDIWRVEIEDGEQNQVLETMVHRFRLIHYNLGCALTCTKKKLPTWGFEQDEVTCNPNKRDPNAIWNIEENIFPRLPNVSFRSYEKNFFQRFIESHVVLINGNSALKPKEGEATSKPWMWPINLRGQFFSGGKLQVYLLGNPIIWWGNLVFMVFYIILWVSVGVREKRGVVMTPREIMLQNRALSACGWLWLGWLLHYLPFWGMTRVLYFHHYFPALLFSSMMTGILLDYAMESIPLSLPQKMFNSTYISILSGALVILFYSFYLFSPLVYGLVRYADSNSTMHHLHWLSTWEF